MLISNWQLACAAFYVGLFSGGLNATQQASGPDQHTYAADANPDVLKLNPVPRAVFMRTLLNYVRSRTRNRTEGSDPPLRQALQQLMEAILQAFDAPKRG